MAAEALIDIDRSFHSPNTIQGVILRISASNGHTVIFYRRCGLPYESHPSRHT